MEQRFFLKHKSAVAYARKTGAGRITNDTVGYSVLKRGRSEAVFLLYRCPQDVDAVIDLINHEVLHATIDCLGEDQTEESVEALEHGFLRYSGW